MDTVKKLLTYIKNLPRLYRIGMGVGVVVLGVVVAHISGSTVSPVPPDVVHVRIASVASLSNQGGPLPVTGKVTSISKADILAVSSGEIISLSRKLGDYVGAGSVIASFENSSQRAAVLQAQGAYEGAQAALAKASGSTAQNSGLTSAQAAQSAENATAAANAALRSAYASLDDAIHTKTDGIFNNPRTASPQLVVTVPDSQLVIRIQTQRVGLDALLESVRTLGGSDVDAHIETAIAKTQIIVSFLDDMVLALNKAIPSADTSATTIATYQVSVAAARTEALAAISSLTSAKTTYDAAVSGASVAQNSASGGTANDIASAQANVKSALGALNAAQANLEKTIIRAPISGTIVSLPITRGGYVPAFSQVAQISNPSALEVETYVTSDDAKTLAVGGTATIDGSTKGVIVAIAPALDPTIGKIQVKIGIVGDQKALTDGDTVTVSLERSIGGTKTAIKNTITIPIAAAKITPEGPVVFTVSSTTLKANPVVFGAILGGQVTVTEGLTLQMDIVTDARGLSDGQAVVVDTN